MLGLQEQQMGKLCFRVICSKGTGHMFMELELIVYWLHEFQDSLEPFFSRRITVPREAKLEAKCERLTVNFIFRLNDNFKLQE